VVEANRFDHRTLAGIGTGIGVVGRAYRRRNLAVPVHLAEDSRNGCVVLAVGEAVVESVPLRMCLNQGATVSARWQISMFLWAAGLACVAPAAEDDSAPKKVALLVGINKYQKPGFSDLKYAEADVAAVGDALEKLGFRVTVLLGSGQRKKQATRVNIEAAARKMVESLTKRDVVLVMLSGHGQQLHPDPDADPAQLDFAKFQSFYSPVDAQMNRPETQVSLTYLVDEILAPNVGTKLLIVDACRDVPVDRSRGVRAAKGIEGRVIALPEDTGVFFSCRAGQMSFERPEVEHGLFTYCLLEGLRGQAERNGEITWADLVAHVNFRMAQPEMSQYMPAEIKQVPIPAGAVPHTVLGKATPRASGSKSTDPASSGSPGRKVKPRFETLTNKYGMQFTRIPAGEFAMGSAETAESLLAAGIEPTNRSYNGSQERPVHQVKITQPFYLGTCEVTKGEFATFVEQSGYQTEAERSGEGGRGYDVSRRITKADPQFNWRNTGFEQTDEHPVVNVSWNDAVAFCEWLSRQEPGRTYRLPTEAEWEYACRGETTTRYATGDLPNTLQGYANLQDASYDLKFPRTPGSAREGPSFPHDDGWPFTSPVGQFQPNAYGLYDLHGNVWEWCSDWYSDTYYSQSPPEDPQGPESGTHKVARGGDWGSTARRARTPERYRGEITMSTSHFGFRVVMTMGAP
jgi:formylglycine-generating enzyme required for sulfatase activity